MIDRILYLRSRIPVEAAGAAYENANYEIGGRSERQLRLMERELAELQQLHPGPVLAIMPCCGQEVSSLVKGGVCPNCRAVLFYSHATQRLQVSGSV